MIEIISERKISSVKKKLSLYPKAEIIFSIFQTLVHIFHKDSQITD